MAFQGDDDCRHCPPAQEPENSHKAAAHHGHNEATPKPACITGQPACCDEIAGSVDARGGKVEMKPGSEVVIAVAPAFAKLPQRLTGQPRRAADPPDVTGSSPPRRVLFCTYLK